MPLTILSSCASDAIGEGADQSREAEVLCSIPELVDDSDDQMPTRSSLTIDATGVNFAWDTNEKITVYGDAGNSGDFTLKGTKDSKANVGIFDGGGFELKSGNDYYTINKSKSSYSPSDNVAKYNIPTINGSRDAFNADSYTNIKVSYDGQRQETTEPYSMSTAFSSENHTAAISHLSQYDYLTADTSANAANACHFKFKRMGCVLRIAIQGLTAGVRYQKLTMYDAAEDNMREMARTTNITSTSSSNEYIPYYNDVELEETSERFSIMLGKKNSNDEELGLEVNSDGTLVAYMMIPPTDLTGKNIAFRLTPLSDSNKPYYATYVRNKPFKANTIVGINLTAQECTNYNINVKVMKGWNAGNTVEQTWSARAKATGDPGIADELSAPKYLYAFFVNDGKLVARSYAEGIPETQNLGTEEKPNNVESWTDANGMYSYNGKWTNTADGSTTSTSTGLTLDASNSTNPRVYIIASSTQISSWKDASGNTVTFAYGTTNGTAESVIQGLSYGYASEAQMRNLYTTAYCDGSTFAGALFTGTGDAVDVKDVRLYHVCSKLDINWENTKTTTVGTYSINSPLSGSVSVNNIPTTNLSFFKPTTNTVGTTAVTGITIDAGTAYTGRQVWYVPQVSGGTYKVTVGSTTKDITFTPDDTYTSWF